MVQIIGLVLDITGAVILIIGTEIMNNLVLGLLDYLKKSVGTLGNDDDYFLITSEASSKKNTSRFCTILGLLFLIIGFCLQIVSTYNNLRVQH